MLLDDGLHLNEKGYEVWTRLLRKEIEPDQINSPNPLSPTASRQAKGSP